MTRLKFIVLITVIVVALSVIVLISVISVEDENRGETNEPAIGYIDINVDEAYKMINEGKFMLIIDVREEEEYIQHHILGAILIPLRSLEGRLRELEGFKDKPVLVYCRSGSRSRVASEILVRYGFRRVYNMKGGIQAWINAGYPVQTLKTTFTATTIHTLTMGN